MTLAVARIRRGGLWHVHSHAQRHAPTLILHPSRGRPTPIGRVLLPLPSCPREASEPTGAFPEGRRGTHGVLVHMYMATSRALALGLVPTSIRAQKPPNAEGWHVPKRPEDLPASLCVSAYDVQISASRTAHKQEPGCAARLTALSPMLNRKPHRRHCRQELTCLRGR